MIKSGIYRIVNKVTGKCYVGSAVNIDKRWKDHFSALNSNSHFNRYLQRSWNKYGSGLFRFEVILYCAKQELLKYEQLAIDVHNVLYGIYNTCLIAGSTLGLRGQVPWNKGLKGVTTPWNKGKTGVFSDSTRKKISESRKGYMPWNKGKKTPKHIIKKLSESHKGYVMPEEQKRKISESLKRHLENQEHWNIGYKHTEDAKRRIAKFQKGRIRSEETRRRIPETKRIQNQAA